MNKLIDLITHDADVMQVTHTKIPSYSEKALTLDYSWTFPAKDLDKHSNLLLKQFERYDKRLTEYTLSFIHANILTEYLEDYMELGRFGDILKIENWKNLTPNLSYLYDKNDHDLNDYLQNLASSLNQINDPDLIIFMIKHHADFIDDSVATS